MALHRDAMGLSAVCDNYSFKFINLKMLSCVCCTFVCVCLFVPCGHLLGKGLPLGSRLWCIFAPLLTFNNHTILVLIWL